MSTSLNNSEKWVRKDSPTDTDIEPQAVTSVVVGQIIALGGTTGTGLFFGAGQGLNMGGPAFLLASGILITLFLYGFVTATNEMRSYLPTPGCSMSYYRNRFVSKTLGSTLGWWVYWHIFAITVTAENTAITLAIKYWPVAVEVHVAVWISITVAVIITR
ncbi:hypothetical protein MKZ38_009866 [Zalerion maritima]|uniref:Amino acid permease/ SLC12A domain-containing protein n=1 Tax=Zalerion maritima TaxID=339359 RepID=A0AAD5RSX2_9PEZI|nr:hypothetical protein MKZ38_009866 [Zalerion maritima]